MTDEHATIAPEYAASQRLRALRTLAEHPDPEVRRLAQIKVGRWASVLYGMEHGHLDIGSRTPVSGVPAWVTLEVLHGGFASGRLAAERPLDAQEQAQLAALSPPEPGEGPRGRLNRYALSPAGQAALLKRLQEGTYRIQYPEEGALAVVSWLNASGDPEGAIAIIEAIAPFMDRLRFTPRAADKPLTAGMSVTRMSARQVAGALRRRRPHVQVARMNETLRVWNPLYDRAVALFLETVEGEPPTLEQGAVVGGWPMRRQPEGWRLAAEALHRDFEQACTVHTLCQKPRNPASYFARLMTVLKACLSGALSPGETRQLRHILGAFLTRHGAPGSPRLERVRAEQASIAALPVLHELAEVLARRLDPYGEGGIPALSLVMGPVSDKESGHYPEGLRLPSALTEKAAFCLEAPIEELIESGIIPSGEVLAEVLPQMTAQIAAAGIGDPTLRRLYSALYGAFRQRRSLLLLNLSAQVRLTELPWVAALSPYRRQSMNILQTSRQALEQLCALNFTNFPQTILPNKLIQEFRALGTGAGLKLTMVEELAADIFMGRFSPKFQQAAHQAAEFLQGTLYAHYYDLPMASELAAGTPHRRHAPAAPGIFAQLCQQRSREAVALSEGERANNVARNGAILEQAQILHTHNLAALFAALDLRTSLGPQLPEMVHGCLSWILSRNAMKVDDWRARLQLVKNTAYAWRQMIFYLSMIDASAQSGVLAGLDARMQDAEAPGVQRLQPVWLGLKAVAAGARFDATGRTGEGRRLLGWSVGPHWLLQR